MGPARRSPRVTRARFAASCLLIVLGAATLAGAPAGSTVLLPDAPIAEHDEGALEVRHQGRPSESIWFRGLGGGWILDSDGEPAWVESFLVERRSGGRSEQVVQHHAVADGALVAVDMTVDLAGDGLGPWGEGTDRLFAPAIAALPPGTYLCWLRNPSPQSLAPACPGDWRPGNAAPQEHTWIAEDGSRITWAGDAATPVLVRTTWGSSTLGPAHLSQPHGVQAGGPVTVGLVRWAPGSAPTPHPSGTSVPAPASAVDTVSRDQLSAVEDRFKHPWPAAAAFEDATRDARGEVARFLSIHTDAYLAVVRGFGGFGLMPDSAGIPDVGRGAPATATTDDRDWWHFVLTDGSHSLAFDVARPRGLDVPGIIWYSRASDETAYPSPDKVPPQAPRVASVLQMADAYLVTPVDEDMGLWGWDIHCSAPCTHASLWLHVVTPAAGDKAEAFARTATHRQPYEYVTVDESGSVVSTRQRNLALFVHAPDAGQQMGTAPGAPVDPGGIALGVAAAAAFVPLLLGILNLLWPHLRALPFVVGRAAVHRHPRRERLLDMLEDSPGLHFSELQRRTQWATGVLDHHLRHLERGGLVRRVQRGQYACFMLAEAPTHARDRTVLVAPARRSIVALLARDGPSTAGTIAARVGRSPSTVTYHLHCLVEAGLVERGDDGAATLTNRGLQVAR